MPKPTAYRYQLPEDTGNVKDLMDIWSTEILSTQVQIVEMVARPIFTLQRR